MNAFSREISPDWQALVDCIMRRGTPQRVHHIELFLDGEVQEAICARFDLLADLDPGSPDFPYQRTVRLQRFLGYDYVRCGVDDFSMPLDWVGTDDTADLKRSGGRRFMNETRGPVTDWASFEQYPWPDPEAVSTRSLAWFEANLPPDMCIIGSGGFAHFAEYLTWLMGYETLCYALFEQRDLVAAIADRLLQIYRVVLARMLQFERVKIVWGSDDMGFKTGPMIGPDDLREFVLPGHRVMAEMAHAQGRPYLLHCCGQVDCIMPDLIDEVRIDAKHSFEDVIVGVAAFKQQYGDRIAVLGGIDVDFLCRHNEAEVRGRVRETLDDCMTGGGYVLGTGNSVANYIPLDNYLAMLDEGRRWP